MNGLFVPSSLDSGLSEMYWMQGEEGRCKATWKMGFKLLWREAGPPNHHDDTVDSDQ